jgi:acyl-CoA synthetase (AMP-forming)/AMP-acid ligase II
VVRRTEERVGRTLVEVVKTLDHSQDRVWAVVSDLESYPRFVREISWCGPANISTRGVGSHYDVRFSVGEGAVCRNDVEVLIHRPPMHLVLVSRHWPDGHVTLRLTPLDAERTELHLTMSLPQRRLPAFVTPRWLRARARKALQLINDHLSGVPGTDSAPRERVRPKTQQRVRVSRVLTQAGALSPSRPMLLRQLAALARRDPTVTGAYRASVTWAPRNEAVSDDAGRMTFADVDGRTNRLANALTRYGVRQGRHVALMCRNHAALLESVIACGKLGAHVLLLNPNLSAAQVADVVRRYQPAAMLLDDEFVPLIPWSPKTLPQIRTWGTGTPTVTGLIERGHARRVKRPSSAGKVTVLTAGRPNNSGGARRRNAYTLRAVAAVLSRIPLREGERMLVAAPLFHSWAGQAAVQLGMPLHATLVLRRHFDAEQTLQLIEQHRCTSVFTEPTALRQIMDLPRRVLRRYDISSLRVVASSGPSMSPHLVTDFMDEFGDLLYNLYGSTETSWASIADPNQLRAAPTTAGRPPVGTRLEILDAWDRPVPPGTVGQICVGDDTFDGHPGNGKPNDLLRTGDQGYLDADGRLFVAGRDNLVVPPDESTFPCRLERLLLTLPQVEDAAVVNVSGQEMDQRLAAYLALRPGETLTAAAVRDFLSAHLPGFAVLRDVIFVDSLTRNATAKVMRKLVSTPRLAE